MSRDPRVDPRPGDMLRKQGYEFWSVGTTPSGMVAFHRFPDEPGALGSRFLSTMDVWRRDMADAEVVNIAEVSE